MSITSVNQNLAILNIDKSNLVALDWCCKFGNLHNPFVEGGEKKTSVIRQQSSVNVRLIAEDRRLTTSMQFYNVKTRTKVEIPDSEVTVVEMKNGKLAAQAMNNGTKLFRIIGKEDAARLGK